MNWGIGIATAMPDFFPGVGAGVGEGLGVGDAVEMAAAKSRGRIMVGGDV
jgi:hypothetical protein